MLIHRRKGTGYGTTIDWWSLGIVCFEMLTGYPPFFDKDFDIMTQKILAKPLRFPSKYGVKPEAQVMVRALLERDPRFRLPCCEDLSGVSVRAGFRGASSGSRHPGLMAFQDLPFFAAINWEALDARALRPPFQPSAAAAVSSGRDSESDVVPPIPCDDTSNFDQEFTGIRLSDVSIEGVTVLTQRGVSTATSGTEGGGRNSTVESESGDVVVVIGKERAKNRQQSKRVPVPPPAAATGGVSPRASQGDGRQDMQYRDFDFMDPGFGDCYLLGNPALRLGRATGATPQAQAVRSSTSSS
jgi:serine/threonine protein kinase